MNVAVTIAGSKMRKFIFIVDIANLVNILLMYRARRCSVLQNHFLTDSSKDDTTGRIPHHPDLICNISHSKAEAYSSFPAFGNFKKNF
jgi:hypothetical protein